MLPSFSISQQLPSANFILPSSANIVYSSQDSGLESFAFGCPNLVNLQVKKCKGVTNKVADWLRSKRASLVVYLDADEIEPEVVDVSVSDGVA
ncbi:Hypothetical predicted protein [Olea europaea subsp. europaea]|uniref:Uncharacterized protein n=1 Tax=Olea europaea subsp. europaea TaxID=158383 RepID=A0A8S0PCA8_OLEEU|nr:Hypothetical predicted protein [Olea europaea subsp. europaea]